MQKIPDMRKELIWLSDLSLEVTTFVHLMLYYF